MDNLQKANIYIINIGAEKLANPNWGIGAKELLENHAWEATQEKKRIPIRNTYDLGKIDLTDDDVHEDDIDYHDICNDGIDYGDTDYNDDCNYDDDDNYYDDNDDDTDDYDTDDYDTDEIDVDESQASVESDYLKTAPYKIDEEERDKLYSGSLPVSLDILNLKKLFPAELYTMNKKTEKKKTFKGDLFNKTDGDKLYTDAIIDITFDKVLYEMPDELKFTHKVSRKKIKATPDFRGKRAITAYELRKKFYDEGVTLRFGDSLVEYVKYKRSAAKAREGHHLFIKKGLKEKMSDWDKFDVHYDDKDENVPLVSIKAYEALTSSGIEKTVKICSNEILLIADVVKDVEIKASVTTELKNGKIIAEDKDKHKAKNIIWDGQSLADTSLFGEEQKGMMLLRNSFFKSCAFNTNIQLWLNNMAGDKECIQDMFGRPVKRTDIKLITTPSSLKFLKFSDKFPGASEKSCYEKWLEKLSSEFGVCKNESASPFGEYHQLSYQIVNSLPLNKEGVRNLLKYDLEHIEKMKNDVAYFKSTIQFKDPMPSDALMLMLLEVNDKMWGTKMVKDYVRDKVDNYIANLRKGHVKVKGSDYAVLFGNPLEMLQYAVNGEIKERPLKGKQIYCSRYENEVKLAGFRNPHITMGNVLFVENIYSEKFKTYFNLSKNIVISNAYDDDSDIMYRLQGHDYDSDTVLLSSEPILVKAAEACQNDKFRVPINGIEAESTKRKYTLDDEIYIDHKTARNKIGEIVNLSQLLNSYYWDWDSKNDKGQHDGLLKEIYTQTSILSSLSQIEIDRAKKDYKTNTGKFLKTLRDKEYNGKLLLKRDQKSFSKSTINDYENRLVSILKRHIENKFISSGIFWAIITMIESGMEIFVGKNSLEIIAGIHRAVKEIFGYDWEKDSEAMRRGTNSILKNLNAQNAYLILEIYERSEENETQTDDGVPLDEKRIKIVTRLIDDLLHIDMSGVFIRPDFFKYCGKGKRYQFEAFNTPMDFLQQIIKEDIKYKDKTDFINISDIIPKPDFRKADNRQIYKIIEACAKADKKIKALRYDWKKSDVTRYQEIHEKEDEVIQKLKKLKIKEDTIKVILYRAFSENTKYYDESYSNMKRHLASWLYQAQPETFKEVIEMSKGK